MKAVLIKWHRGDQYEKRGQRRAAIHNAQRTIRQQTKLQLQKYLGKIDVSLCGYYPLDVWNDIDGWLTDTADLYDDFIQPTIRLGYFD